MRVHISIYAFNTDSNEFYTSTTIFICNIGDIFSLLSLYLYEHDRLYKYYIDIYYDYSGSTTSMRTRCQLAYRTLFETVVAVRVIP